MVTFAGKIRRVFVFAMVLAACSTQVESRAAEMRTWTAASGGFTVEAELVLVKPGDVAQLKTKDGRTLDVPLAQLSAADQEYAKQTTPAASTATSATSPVDYTTASAKFNDVQKQADRCRTPDEVLVLFKVFHDDAATSAEDRALAAARIAECKQLAAEKKVRLNKQWISADEAAAVRKKADELMRQGLELWKLDQEDNCKKKFAEAAALEPEEIRAEFILGFIYTLDRRVDKALPIFQRCMQRDPDNIAVLNNIALLSAARGDWVTTAGYWRKALAKQPDQRVMHNIGRFLSQAGFANIAVPKGPRETLALPYTELIASGKFKATDPELGWLVLLIEESALDFSLKDDEEQVEKKKVAVPETNDDGIVVGGGTGFVVHPGYVMTNAHVAEDDAVFEIQTTDGKRLRGTRVAKADGKIDLALIKCEELTAPPLVLASDVAPRGTDVMLLGFPEFYLLGATLKATRGSISSVPDPNIENSYLYDAVTNSGNSGGPVCDASGNVIAVHFASMNTASRYGCGVPSSTAREFLAKTLADQQTQPIAPAAKKLDWPEIDAKVSPSTVLVWVRKKNAPATKSRLGSDVLELPICLFCGGMKHMRCNAPNCAKNRAAGRGRSCTLCQGTGIADCQVCDGIGFDIQLASVQEAIKRAKAIKATRAAAADSPVKSTGTAGAGPGAVAHGPSAQGDEKISLGMLNGIRGQARPGQPSSLAENRIDQGLGFDPGLTEMPTKPLTNAEIDEIIKTLQANPSAEAIEAAKRLASSKPTEPRRNDVAEALERWILPGDGHWQAKSHMCRALTYWGREASKPKIHAMLRDNSWIVRRQAAITIAHMRDESGIAPLIECLLRPADVNDASVNTNFERGLFMRPLITFGSTALPILQRAKLNANPKVQEMLDYIIAACRS